MSDRDFDQNSDLKVWFALRRLDKNDDRVVALREVSIPPEASKADIIQITASTFGLNPSGVVFKVRNSRGCLIPLNSSMAKNTKHMPHVLEVVKVHQHVRPTPRTIPVSVINKSIKTRLQVIDRRIQKLEDFLPQIKIRRSEKLSQEIDCLNQKLRFLQTRMEEADSQSWKGMLTRAPLW